MLETFLSQLGPILSWLGQVLIGNNFNFIWCSATVLYFAFWLVLLFRRALPIRADLGRAAALLDKVDGPTAFAKIFDTYTKRIRAEKALVHAWSEFEESLIMPREGESRIRNTREPGWYFHDAAIVEPVVHNRFLDTVPSHLVGLGILGTFLGLAAGVGLASDKLGSDTATPQEIQKALSQLLNGASLAFTTSIFGLGCSLIFLWIERSLIGSVHRRLGAWVSKLESCVELVTPEKVALDQLQQQERQTKQLENFNTQLVFALESALEEKVANRLGPLLDKVVHAVEALRVDRADSNVDAMQKMVEEFTKSLTQSTGREMKQIATTLEDLGERFRMLITAAEESQNRSRGMIDSAAQSVLDALVSGASALTTNLRGAVDELSVNLRRASEDLSRQVAGAGAQIGDSGKASADQIAVTLASLDQRTQALMAAAEESQRRGRELIDGATKSTLDSIVAGAGMMTADLKGASGEISANLRRVAAELVQQVAGVQAQIGESSRASAEQIAAALRGFSESVSRLGQVTSSQGAMADRISELTTGLRGAGETLLEAHRGFTASLDPSRALAHGMEVASGRLAESLNATGRLVEQAAAAGKAIQSEQEKIAAAWRDYEERFRGVDQSLVRAFEQLDQGVGRYTSQIQAFHTEADQHMGKAVDKLASATGELLQAVEDLGDKLPPDRR